jgi:NAD(P)H dehydrogenase (quinone)
MKVLIVYYSMYGHIRRMAEAVVAGVDSTGDAHADLRRVPETLSDGVLEQMGATEALHNPAAVPVATVADLAQADAIIFGTPTRFGNMCGQLRQFLDATGQLWQSGTLVGRIGSVFTGSNTQHGGQESTLLSVHVTLLHHGMLIAGLPYSFEGQTRMDEISGCSPYGASTIAGADGQRRPSENELAGAHFQGRHVATLARRLADNRP